MTHLYMLDTNTVSYILKGVSPAARHRLSHLEQDEVACVSSVTAAELWYGLTRIGASEPRRRVLQTFLSHLQVLPWTSEEAVVYGAFRAQQESHGKPLGPLDTLIAAHSIAVQATLVSSDAAFRHAAGLHALESWATDLIS
jgi:tRNA(fMet)-specific endonuclease VapC